MFSLEQHHLTIKHGARGAHPGTEECPVCGCLMLRMVPGMFSRLRLSQATDHENTKHKRYRKEFSECLAHARMHFLMEAR